MAVTKNVQIDLVTGRAFSSAWRWTRPVLPVLITVILGNFYLLLHAASSAVSAAANAQLEVFSAAEETAPVIETVAAGSILVPMAEMLGAGGAKWFMVKTPSGNIGWIKSDSQPMAKKIDEHFRTTAKESIAIGPMDAASAKDPATRKGAITIPVIYIGKLLVAPVTITNTTSSATGYFFVDTGASRTVISKRMARDLRLVAVDNGVSFGIGGSVSNDIALVDSIRVGRAVLERLPVSIHDFSPDPRLEGLLGLDFLGRFQMSVDVDKRIMTLTPR